MQNCKSVPFGGEHGRVLLSALAPSHCMTFAEPLLFPPTAVVQAVGQALQVVAEHLCTVKVRSRKDGDCCYKAHGSHCLFI